MPVIAALPMYDLPELGLATDGLWAALAERLSRAGMCHVPVRLSRGCDLQHLWDDPQLLLGQTCGYPLVHRLRDRVQVVGTPTYTAPGCGAGEYCAWFVARDDSAINTITDLAGRRFAINGWDSLSGCHLPFAALRSAGVAPPGAAQVQVSGGHRAGLAMVTDGRADAVAIDCVTYALLARVAPGEIGALKIVGRTAPAPALPFITAAATRAADLKRLRRALAEVCGARDTAAIRNELHIGGFRPASLRHYDRWLRSIGVCRT